MKHRDEILRLRAEGKSYNEIHRITGASTGTISFHCGKGQKEKYYKRCLLANSKKHPYKRKIERFIIKHMKIPKIKKQTYTNKLLLKSKIDKFHYNRKIKEYEKISFTFEDIINKFGDNPKCYLTGKPININKPRAYHFDHIVPVSKGGANTLDNLGICTKEANMSKTDHTLEEFIDLCKDVLKTHGYNITKVAKSGNEPD